MPMDDREPAGAGPTVSRAGGERRNMALRGCVLAVALCALITLPAWLLPSIGPANLMMVYLLAVLLVALFYGRWPSALSAVINVASFDLFFVQPRGSLAVSDLQYLVTFAVMLIVGLTVGNLTAGVRYQARIARYREQRARQLYAMSKALCQALTQRDIAAIARHFIRIAFGADARLFLWQAGEMIDLTPTERAGGRPVDTAIVRWSFDHALPAGPGAEALPGLPYRLCPLTVDRHRLGVLAVEPMSAEELSSPEQQRLLESCTVLIAGALERFELADRAEQARLAAERERLRNALLSALSHDLRTPLTILSGQAEMLNLDLADAGSPFAARADGIHQQALATTRLVNNLLDMARLQSGGVIIHPSWQSLEEMIGGALRLLRIPLAGNRVAVDLPDPLLLVSCDDVLLERVLVNLLENAVKYAGPDAVIVLRALTRPGWLEIQVEDNGPGIAPGAQNTLFDKFSRGHQESAIPGVGLGLAICRAIIEIHRGRIWADNTSAGGACFHFTLPLDAPPAITPPEET
ncbi:DUF4118 domain-containing protein [Enterobacteriales bacterium SAP-6]|uniref:histidine kinase n=1 Tax=Acerihabitans arboris TaxID=2691583 RepID=A0A845SJC8_9GAMM|nr:DUF4118 domain-containing protein [Acerihabitans arboris]